MSYGSRSRRVRDAVEDILRASGPRPMSTPQMQECFEPIDYARVYTALRALADKDKIEKIRFKTQRLVWWIHLDQKLRCAFCSKPATAIASPYVDHAGATIAGTGIWCCDKHREVAGRASDAAWHQHCRSHP